MILRTQLRAHLVRLAWWSAPWPVAWIATGILSGPFSEFWMVAGCWALVNLAIVLGSWRSRSRLHLARFREFLQLNLGLDAGFILAGGAMVWLGPKEAGLAVILQAAGLIVLDGILLRNLPPPPDSEHDEGS
ncbi:MAG: hypothetical protein MH204_00155 [Fimbriimonadaceae bacterium]|nr:hypothetical protein [Fimbriimonadaceae bacterium]